MSVAPKQRCSTPIILHSNILYYLTLCYFSVSKIPFHAEAWIDVCFVKWAINFFACAFQFTRHHLELPFLPSYFALTSQLYGLRHWEIPAVFQDLPYVKCNLNWLPYSKAWIFILRKKLFLQSSVNALGSNCNTLSSENVSFRKTPASDPFFHPVLQGDGACLGNTKHWRTISGRSDSLYIQNVKFQSQIA